MVLHSVDELRQPDQGMAATAAKAKDDLLAAEKALDDDDEGEKEIPAKSLGPHLICLRLQMC